MFGRKKKKEQEEAFKMLLEGMAKLHENPYDDAAFVNDEDYGYTSKKPIMTFRVPGSNQYLESLVTENGETITWNRVGSTSDPDIDGMIDIYEIFCNANKITTLYLNMYGVSNSKHTPKGFLFKGANKSGSNEVAPEIEQPQKPIEKKPEVINNHERNIPPTDNIDDAIKQLKKAIFMSKDPEGLWISLAELYVEKGEMQNARSALNKAQAVNSGQPDLEAAKQRILDKLESSTSTISNEPATQSAPAECLSLDAAKEAILKVAKQALSAINAENTALGAEEATKKQFAQDLIWYCAKRFRGFGQEKIQDESILTAFYAGICYTISTVGKTLAENDTIFSFLKGRIGIDQLERFANSRLNNSSDSEKVLWNAVSPFITEARATLAKVEAIEEQQTVLEFAVKSSFAIGEAIASNSNCEPIDPIASNSDYEPVEPIRVQGVDRLINKYQMLEKVGNNITSEILTQESTRMTISIIAETPQYYVYEYSEKYGPRRKSYLLRQNKAEPSEVIFLGQKTGAVCLLWDTLFIARENPRGKESYIDTINLHNGMYLKHEWLAKGCKLAFVNGHGRYVDYYPDRITNMQVVDGELIILIEREKGFLDEEDYDTDITYQLKVHLAKESFIITAYFPDGKLERKEEFIDSNRNENYVYQANIEIIDFYSKEYSYDEYMEKGLSALSRRDEISILYFRKAIELNPNTAEPWIKLSEAYNASYNKYGQPETEKAIEALKKATSVSPNSAEIWEKLGWQCLESRHCDEEAIKAFEKALSINWLAWESMIGKAILSDDKEALRMFKRFERNLKASGNEDAQLAYLEKTEKVISNLKAGYGVFGDTNNTTGRRASN